MLDKINSMSYNREKQRKADQMKFQIETLKSYSIIPNKFIQDKRLSLKAKGLLATFYSLPNDWDYSINGLCKITNTGITAIRNIICELEIYGYLKREETKNEKGQYDYIYHVFLEPKKAGYTNTLSSKKLNTRIQKTCIR